MKKKYIKPSVVVEVALFNTLMNTVSIPIKGDVDNEPSYTINAKRNAWCDEEDGEYP